MSKMEEAKSEESIKSERKSVVMYGDGYDDVTKTEGWKRSEAKIIQKLQEEKKEDRDIWKGRQLSVMKSEEKVQVVVEEGGAKSEK